MQRREHSPLSCRLSTDLFFSTRARTRRTADRRASSRLDLGLSGFVHRGTFSRQLRECLLIEIDGAFGQKSAYGS